MQASVDRDKKLIFHFLMSVIYTALMLLFGYWFGAFDGSANIARERNAAIAMPVMTAFGWFGGMFLFKKTQQSLSEYLVSTNAQKFVEAVLNELEFQRKLYIRISLIAGILFTVSYLLVEQLIAFNTSALKVFLALSAVPFWGTSCLLVLQLVLFTRYVINNFFDSDTINNHGISKLFPISDLVVANTIVTATFISLIPIFWLGKEIPLIDLLFMVAIFIVFAWFLFMPLIKTHSLISRRKQLEMKKLNESIHEIMLRARMTTSEDIFKDINTVRDLAILLKAKRRTSNTSDWPISMGQSIRVTVLSFGIPMAWAAGAVIENLIIS